jgi:hypothetical protein
MDGLIVQFYQHLAPTGQLFQAITSIRYNQVKGNKKTGLLD